MDRGPKDKSPRTGLAADATRLGGSPHLRHDRAIFLFALLTGLPGSVVALALLWFGDFTLKVELTLTVFIICFWLGFAISLREKVVFPLQTISNLLAALREGDYSIRARGGGYDDPLGAVVNEVNMLGEELREQRLDALEATTLLRKVMEEIDLAIFTFDEKERLALVNRSGEKLLAQPGERLLGRTAEEIGLADCLKGNQSQTLEKSFPGGMGRWAIKRTNFREGGLPHTLLVLTDLSKALRDEERQAWQRLLRVLGHELNNSLAPIKSMAGTMESLLSRDPRPPDWQEDVQRGLSIIGKRTESLIRFMSAYSKLARLPQPQLEPLQLGELVRRVVNLESRLEVDVNPGPEVTVNADGDQLEQLLINILRNAVDAVQETKGRVEVGWDRQNGEVDVWVRDEGPGLPDSPNLFVPFFTTKPGGSGIGLALSRQIAEAHGGVLVLKNRTDTTGCEAHLKLPV